MNRYLVVIEVQEANELARDIMPIYAFTPEEAAETMMVIAQTLTPDADVDVLGMMEVEPDEDEEAECACECAEPDAIIVQLDGSLTAEEITEALARMLGAKPRG